MISKKLAIGILLATYTCHANADDVKPAVAVTTECIEDITTTKGDKEGLENISSDVEMCRLNGDVYKVAGKINLTIPDSYLTDDLSVSYSLCSVGNDNRPACSDGGFLELNQGEKVDGIYRFKTKVLSLRRSRIPGTKVKVNITISEKNKPDLHSQDHYLN
ncbi:MAG: hypothetical protein Q8Q01_05285 [archaeon]|nr:hypothetical protein [archaeon]